MLKLKKLIAAFSLFVISMLLMMPYANAQQEERTANLMRSNGKIYVVVVVILIILLGLFIYLANLDRKIKKLEKGNDG